MLGNKIVYSKDIYNFGVDYFFHRSYIFCLLIENIVENTSKREAQRLNRGH